MALPLKLGATLRYGTYVGAAGRPSAADREALAALRDELAADMGADAAYVTLEPTATVSWPCQTLVLSYSLFHPEAAALNALAQVWKSKLETAYDCTVHISSSTD